METLASNSAWWGFLAFVVWATYVDIRGTSKTGPMTARDALKWSLLWVVASLVFCVGLGLVVAQSQGQSAALTCSSQFLTGYLLEKSLAVDNLFVFLLIFRQLRVPPELQPRALVLGIVAAIVLRAAMIFAGAWLISKFHAVLYLFGAFLLWSGWKMWSVVPGAPSDEVSPIANRLQRHLSLCSDYRGPALWIREGGKFLFTPLTLVLLTLAVTDLVFAVDSIPAIFAVTQDPFIVLTSNVFAVLGLRAMYFLLAHWFDRFRYLGKGLSLVLSFIGLKMLLMGWIKIPALLSLLVVATILSGSVWLSQRRALQPPA
jgi:tellurite resistance protein TerC